MEEGGGGRMGGDRKKNSTEGREAAHGRAPGLELPGRPRLGVLSANRVHLEEGCQKHQAHSCQARHPATQTWIP